MTDTPERIKRRNEFERWRRGNEFVDGLIARLTAFRQEYAGRYVEVDHPHVVPILHFTNASQECIFLYAEAYYVSAVMVTQAVAEGIRKFALERNGVKLDSNVKGPEAVELLVGKGIISDECAEAFNRIYDSYRNDVHHMNPKVAEIDFPKLAKGNIQDLAAIEREIFACGTSPGGFDPGHPQYWNIGPAGTAPVFLP